MTGRRLACLAAGALVAAVALAPAPARADADLASDVLLDSNVYLPSEANVPPEQRARLSALTRQAATLRIPIRIAVIPNVLNLGSVQSLWGKPQRYANFLGTELVQDFHGRVLVVMPQGLGVYHDGRPVDVDRSALRGIRVSPVTLGSAAIQGTLELARVAGRRLGETDGRARTAASAKAGQGGPGAALWIAIAAAAAAVVILAAVALRLRPSLGRDGARGRLRR